MNRHSHLLKIDFAGTIAQIGSAPLMSGQAILYLDNMRKELKQKVKLGENWGMGFIIYCRDLVHLVIVNYDISF